MAAVFGIAEHGDDGASYITQAYVRQGRLAGVYRKRHPGDGEVLARLPDWREGTLIADLPLTA